MRRGRACEIPFDINGQISFLQMVARRAPYVRMAAGTAVTAQADREVSVICRLITGNDRVSDPVMVHMKVECCSGYRAAAGVDKNQQPDALQKKNQGRIPEGVQTG